MTVEEKSISKILYKAVLYLIKVIPMLYAFLSLLNTILSYFDIDVPLLSYIGSVSLLTLLLMYLTSYAFRFCIYHRMFIHYTLVNWVLNIIDYYIGIPVSDRSLFILYISITGLFLFAILYVRRRYPCYRNLSSENLENSLTE